MKRRRIAIAVLFLIVATLACNIPERQTEEPPPTVTPFVPQEVDPTDEPPPSEPTESVDPTEGPPPPTNTSEPAATTEPPPPTATTEAVSAGPLEFPMPTSAESVESLGNGKYMVTFMVRISGGAPPFTIIHQDVGTYVSSGREYPLSKEWGCGAMTGNVRVESADGQTYSQDYYIPDNWCPD